MKLNIKDLFRLRFVWELEHTDFFFHTLGNGAGPLGITVRHPAVTSVWVPSRPPLALCYPDCGRYGLPGDQEVHPQGPGCEKCAACFQGNGEDWGLWTDERPEPREGSLHHVSTQTHTVRMVRNPGKVKDGSKYYLKFSFKIIFFAGVLQRVFVLAPSLMPQTCGCLVSPCGRCSPTVRSPGLVCQADR